MKTRSLIVLLLIAVIILTSAWGVFCGIPVGAERFAPMEVLQLGAEVKGETSILLDLQPEEGEEGSKKESRIAMKEKEPETNESENEDLNIF